MNIKQKFSREREQVKTNNRYQLVKNFDSVPYLRTSREDNTFQNKENQMKNLNKQQTTYRELSKSNNFETFKSTELIKRLKTSINQVDHEMDNVLRSSQDIFQFKNKDTLRCESINFGQNLTFGFVNKKNNENHLKTSKQFLDEKQLKKQILDELIMKSKRGLCRSLNDMHLLTGSYCANHTLKKAKYRLISELTEGEQQMFYCSKCAINLLQQGFKIEQLTAQSDSNLTRMKQITSYELKMKTIEEKICKEGEKQNYKTELIQIKNAINAVNSEYYDLAQIIENMRLKQNQKLKQVYLKKQLQQKMREATISQILSQIRDIQIEIKDYKTSNKFMLMKDNQFQFLVSTLNNKIESFQKGLFNFQQKPYICNRISKQQIVNQLSERIFTENKLKKSGELTFDKKERLMIENEYTCDYIKQPFRNLFPEEDEIEADKRSMLSSVRQCPTFGQYS